MESAANREQPIISNDKDEIEPNGDALSRTETIKVLNESIDRLEQTVAQISENRLLPSAKSINTLSTTTQELINAVTLTTPKTEPTPAPETTTTQPTAVRPASPSTVKSPVDSQQPIVKPVVKAQKKNLSIIAICIAAIAVAIVAIFQIWLPRQEVSRATATTPSIAEPTITEIGEVNSPESTIVETPLDNSLDNTEPTVSELPPANEPVAEMIPQNLESPGRTKNFKLEEIAPNLDFTPEQTLISTLGTKIAALTKKYPSELFDSIKVDLPHNSLTVNITDDWYELDPSRQTKLANEVLERSRQLNFAKLKLQDRRGTLVARNPVIGDRIIIVQDSKE